MTHQYLVVDQNFLRTDALRDMLRAQRQIRIVLPDLAMFEMAKSTNRKLTINQSLSIVAEEPGRVFVSHALGHCLSYELKNGVAVDGHMLDQKATKFLRKLLNAVSTGIRNPEYDGVIDDPENHVSGMKRDYLDHTANKARSLELLDVTKRSMTGEFAKRLRGSRATVDEKLDFIYEKAPSLLVGVLEENGFSREKATRFYRKKPMILRYFFAKLWACLSWEEQGRIEGLSPAKVSNDLIDHQYVLAATYFDGVLSEEPAVNEAYAAVQQLLARAQPLAQAERQR